MSLAIAVGKSSSSSYLLWKLKEHQCDDSSIEPTIHPARLGVALALSADQTLRAVATVQVNLEKSCIELSVRISPASEPLTEQYAETICQITFAPSDDHAAAEPTIRPSSDNAERLSEKMELSLLFSSDCNYLSCLVPSPYLASGGTLVVFHLYDVLHMTRKRPLLPSYIYAHSQFPKNRHLVAGNHQVLNSGTILGNDCQITAIEDATMSCRRFEGGPSILFVACQDGTILGFSYQPLTVTGLLYHPQHVNENGKMWSALTREVRQLKHCTEWDDGIDGSTGKLAALCADGIVAIFSTHLTAMRGGDEAMMMECHASSPLRSERRCVSVAIQLLHRIPGQSFICSEWLCGSYLAIVRSQDTTSSVECYAVANDGAKPIAVWELTAQRLQENRHAGFVVDETNKVENASDTCCSRITLQYDPVSEGLIVSGDLVACNEVSGLIGRLSFACVWNWRSNVESVIIASNVVNQASSFSVAKLCRDASGAAKLVHTSSCFRLNATFRADIYIVAHLSPRSSILVANGKNNFWKSNNLLLAATSLSYPNISCSSAKRDFEMEWRESAIPADYIQSHGALRLAAIGSKWGRWVAVASLRGFCTCDIRSDNVENACAPSPSIEHVRSRTPRRWRRFGKVSEEGRFTVLALTWWEGHTRCSGEGIIREDLIIVVIEVREGDGAGRYLSCWSPNILDLDHQLLFPASAMRKYRWGVPLPNNFHPASLDILSQPDTTQNNGTRRAIVLLSDDSAVTSFQIYQLQLVVEPLLANDPYKDALTYFVLARCAAANEIGTPADLLLSSGFFGFNLEISTQSRQDQAHIGIATIAARRSPAQGLDAICVNHGSIVAVGSILATRADKTACEVVNVWRADYLQKQKLNITTISLDVMVWLLELTDGSFVSWFVPVTYVAANNERLLNPIEVGVTNNCRNFVRPRRLILGYTTPAGKATTWLHQSTSEPSKNLMLAAAPMSEYGCMLGCGQAVLKFHQELGEDFERDKFRSDFLGHEVLVPSAFILSFPAFLPSYYSQVLDNLGTMSKIQAEMEPFYWRLEKRIQSSTYQDIAFKSLQLLLTRLVEEIGDITERQEACRITESVFATIVEFARYTITPLQFAAVFIEIGRQLEPRYLNALFPLPNSLTERDSHDGDTLLDLYEMSLDYGSILAASSSLPLLHDTETLQHNCHLILGHCLDAIEVYFESFGHTGFDVVSEEQFVLCDVFRYALKLEDVDSQPFVETDSSDDDDSMSTNFTNSGRSPIFCGMLGRSQPRTTDAKVNSKASYVCGNDCTQVYEATIDNGACMVGHYLIKLVFKQEQWRKAAALAILVVGDSTTGLDLCSKPQFTRLVTGVRLSDLPSLSGGGRTASGLVEHFTNALRTCGAQNESGNVGKLFDVVLVLLRRSANMPLQIPGLLFIAMVAGHVSGRGGEVLDDEVGNSILSKAFHRAVAASAIYQ
ncbi:hypothetical protein MPSEU_000902200 [Mayamaea pseudoterrestris]|nr:hypothetical protein MPSEU_000902200 [Mayamaea pseudoterrestris]